jgi:hypothetical protein
MSRTLTAVTSSLLAAAVLAPAAMADVHLGGSPRLIPVDAHHARLEFAADRIPSHHGRLDARVRFAGGQRVSGLKAVGTHGDDIRYGARVTSRRPLREGAKYTVRLSIPGQATLERLVKLHD